MSASSAGALVRRVCAASRTGSLKVMFGDRTDAGRRLAALLSARSWLDPVVLGLPRGGVPVAAEVARTLGVALEVVVARKLGAPGRPELGIGAVAEGGALVRDEAAIAALGVTEEQLEEITLRERAELRRRVETYRGGRPLPDLRGREVLVVDDGLATGVTAEAALAGLRVLGADHLVLAVPVGAPDSVRRLASHGAGEVVCLLAPAELRAVGQWYRRFDATSDDEVLALLASGSNDGPPR